MSMRKHLWDGSYTRIACSNRVVVPLFYSSDQALPNASVDMIAQSRMSQTSARALVQVGSLLYSYFRSECFKDE